MLPADYSGIAGRIDPDNAWFDVFGSAAGLEWAVEKKKLPILERGTGKLETWKIRDQERIDRALARLRAARGKPRFESYEEELLRKRIALLPQETPLEWLGSVSYVAGEERGMARLRDLGQVLAAEAWRLGETGDVEGLRALREDALDFVGRLVGNEDCRLISQLVVVRSSVEVLSYLHAATVKLGIEDEEPKVGDWYRRLDDFAEERKARRRRPMSGSAKIFSEQGSLFQGLASMYTSWAKEPPRVSADDLKPGRLMDHLSLGLILTGGLWLAMGGGLLSVALYAGAQGHRDLRLLAERVTELLRPVDWCWMVGGGVLAPVAAAMGLIWLTPAGGTEWSLEMTRGYGGLELPVFLYAALGLWIVIAAGWMVRWRLRVRAEAFGFRRRGERWDWLAAAPAVACLAGASRFGDNRVVPVLLGLSALWLVWVTLAALMSRVDGLLPRLAAARVLMGVFVAAMLVMAAVAGGMAVSHRYWFRRDDFVKLTPEAPVMQPYEYQVGVRMREELREAMEGR